MFYKLTTPKSEIPYYINFESIELIKPLSRKNWFEIQFKSGQVLRIETDSILRILDEIYAQKYRQ
jgi:hypothetical protein